MGLTHQKKILTGVTINKRNGRGKGEGKVFYSLSWGRELGQRVATGIFTWTNPKDQVQKNQNKEALAILENKRSQIILDRQSIAANYIPAHKYKPNFLDYYKEFTKTKKYEGSPHLEGSFTRFKAFLEKSFLAPIDITENLCQRFRKYLVDHLNGDTPHSDRVKQVNSVSLKGWE